jgi:hypothetical protein
VRGALDATEPGRGARLERQQGEADPAVPTAVDAELAALPQPGARGLLQPLLGLGGAAAPGPAAAVGAGAAPVRAGAEAAASSGGAPLVRPPTPAEEEAVRRFQAFVQASGMGEMMRADDGRVWDIGMAGAPQVGRVGRKSLGGVHRWRVALGAIAEAGGHLPARRT